MLAAAAAAGSVRRAGVIIGIYHNPDQPTISAAEGSTTALLTGSPFHDDDPGDTHAVSQWQTTLSSDTEYASVIDDSGEDSVNLLSYTATGLATETEHICRVRYKDNFGNWSAYSASDTFTTTAAGAEPWFEENWDYADTAAMKAAVSEYSGDTETLATGLTTPYGGTKAMLVTLDENDKAGGVGYDLPDYATHQEREIWQEVYMKFSGDWKTDFGGVGNPDHKTMQWYDQAFARRWGFKIGTFGHDLQLSASPVWYIGIDGSGYRLDPNHDTEIWNNIWIRWRFHLDMGTESGSDGVYETLMDNTLVAQDTACETSNLSGDYFRHIIVGRALNQWPTPSWQQEWWIGRIRTWKENPGWDFGSPP